jgi:hypothetical protein
MRAPRLALTGRSVASRESSHAIGCREAALHADRRHNRFGGSRGIHAHPFGASSGTGDGRGPAPAIAGGWRAASPIRLAERQAEARGGNAEIARERRRAHSDRTGDARNRRGKNRWLASSCRKAVRRTTTDAARKPIRAESSCSRFRSRACCVRQRRRSPLPGRRQITTALPPCEGRARGIRRSKSAATMRGRAIQGARGSVRESSRPSTTTFPVAASVGQRIEVKPTAVAILCLPAIL